MQEPDARYRAYLEQLQALTDFRRTHGELHPGEPIDDEDPAVRRLTEALAFFSVGTQLAAENNMRSSLERLLGGYFDFLLSPMPAMATLQLTHTERLIDTALLPEGVPLGITAPDGAVGTFRTLHELPILPARLERTEVLVREDGFRLLVQLRASFPVRSLESPLPLRVSYLDRFVGSLRLVHHLQRHLTRASAFFDERPADERPGAACKVEFGAVAAGATVSSNPLERLRLLLHYPELELALHVTVPEAPRPWTRLVLAFDLDSKWPDSRAAANDPFVLHAVPVVNLRRAPAAAIRCDGLRSVHALVPNEKDRDFTLASVSGVYELTREPDGFTPLAPAGLLDGDEGYEIERVHTPSGVRHRLILRLPGAFAEPRRVVVEAEWHQPWFAAHAVGPLKAALTERHIEGLQLRLLGRLRPPAESPLDRLSSALLELLAMRMKPTLRREELIALLRLLGVGSDSPFLPLLDRIRDLSVDSTPSVGLLSARHRYRLRLDPIGAGDEALTWTLVTRIRELLDAWSGGDVATVEVEVDHDAPQR